MPKPVYLNNIFEDEDLYKSYTSNRTSSADIFGHILIHQGEELRNKIFEIFKQDNISFVELMKHHKDLSLVPIDELIFCMLSSKIKFKDKIQFVRNFCWMSAGLGSNISYICNDYYNGDYSKYHPDVALARLLFLPGVQALKGVAEGDNYLKFFKGQSNDNCSDLDKRRRAIRPLANHEMIRHIGEIKKLNKEDINFEVGELQKIIFGGLYIKSDASGIEVRNVLRLIELSVNSGLKDRALSLSKVITNAISSKILNIENHYLPIALIKHTDFSCGDKQNDLKVKFPIYNNLKKSLGDKYSNFVNNFTLTTNLAKYSVNCNFYDFIFSDEDSRKIFINEILKSFKNGSKFNSLKMIEDNLSLINQLFNRFNNEELIKIKNAYEMCVNNNNEEVLASYDNIKTFFEKININNAINGNLKSSGYTQSKKKVI